MLGDLIELADELVAVVIHCVQESAPAHRVFGHQRSLGDLLVAGPEEAGRPGVEVGAVVAARGSRYGEADTSTSRSVSARLMIRLLRDG